MLTRHIIRRGFAHNGYCPSLNTVSSKYCLSVIDISAWFAKSLRSILRTSLHRRIADVASRSRTFAGAGAHYRVANARRWQPFARDDLRKGTHFSARCGMTVGEACKGGPYMDITACDTYALNEFVSRQGCLAADLPRRPPRASFAESGAESRAEEWNTARLL